MIGFLATGDNQLTDSRTVKETRLLAAIRVTGLVVVIITVSVANPGPTSGDARGTAIAVTLGLSAAAWIVWLLAGPRRPMMITGLIGMGAAGAVLAGLSPNSPAIVVGCMATFGAGVRLKTEFSLGVVAGTVALFLVTSLVVGTNLPSVLGYSFALVGLWAVALSRLVFLVRAEQAERMLAETRRAREAEMHAAALAERTRIARDIHDVLAHSLAAVSVNLQAAEGLLASDTLPADNPELAKAMECIDRAGTLTREGLAAARRAVLALREDAAPLPDQLSSLASQHRAAGDATVDFEVTGAVRPLSEQVSEVAFRTAQEALTNARKHAPGQPVALGLGFETGQVTVSVVNPMPPVGGQRPLAATGAGYGLTGLRERAELAGGTLEAGPADGRWRVCLRIPA